ncbi:hypothetical protein BGZ60DRAFT_529662 [Tricladium varicosporioides]|nr:hypothetical protein BGZ60DRAFT_529662 [Hymenoscyphus varicosporioides]
MVTGVETAGIVLGSIPLIVSALEHYAEGISTIEKWWKYKRELASLKRVLGAEYDRFLNTLEELLAGIVPDATLAALLNAPGGVAWRDPELNRKLQTRLRKSYNSYLDTINDLNEVVTILKVKLELDSSGKPKWTDSKTFRREYKRIKFSLSKSAYEELVKRIEKDNDTLANLTGQSLRLEPTRQRRNLRTPEFELIRLQAESLYRVLKKNICCSCQTPHNVNLRLEARTSSVNNGENGNMRFRMVFTFDTTHGDVSHLPWKHRYTEIEPLEICGEIGSLEIEKLHVSSLPSPDLNPNGTKKGVKWALDSSPKGSTTSLPPPYSPSTTNEIRDLCAAFKDYKGTDNCLGFILDEKRLHHIYPFVNQPSLDNLEPITLSKRLADPRRSVGKLTRKERLQVALTLAASVLQLHKTAWLSENWSTDDIYFLEGSPGPHISRSFSHQASSHMTSDTTTQPKPLPIVRNKTLFALGIILIELCLGSPLSTLQLPEDITPNQQLTDFMTARRLITDVYDEGGGRYGDAVRRCVHCEFDQRLASLDVEAFRGCFYQGVVVPLEEDWRDFCRLQNSVEGGVGIG